LEIWNNIWPYAVAVLLFLTLVIIHEFGHFIAAKLFKVKVNEDGMMTVDIQGNDPRTLLVNVGGTGFNAYYYNSAKDEIRLGSISDIKDAESVGSSFKKSSRTMTTVTPAGPIFFCAPA